MPGDLKALSLSAGLAGAALLLVVPVALACPCGTNCQCGPSCACAPSPSSGPPSSLQVRRNQRNLTDDERRDFVNAVLMLKQTVLPGATLSIYDTFVQQHGDAFRSHQAHEGPAFLPWHRQFLLDFERELQRVNPNVTIPYWDFTVDQSPTAAPWTPDFLGGNGDPFQGHVVTDGPFQRGQWQLVIDGPDLRRELGLLLPTLPTAQDVERAFTISQYDAPPWGIGSPIDESFRTYVEGFGHPTFEPEMHNRVHLWIGGSSSIIHSPNDPIFWLLHANFDRIWAEWQAIYGLTYMPTMGGPPGHNLFDRMSPSGVRPVDVLDHFALGYRYDTESVAIPEPGSWALLAVGALTLMGGRWLRRGKEAVAFVFVMLKGSGDRAVTRRDSAAGVPPLARIEQVSFPNQFG